MGKYNYGNNNAYVNASLHIIHEICVMLEQVMFSCGKYNLVHEFFRKLQKSFIPNSLTYRGILIYLYLCQIAIRLTFIILTFLLYAVLVNTLWKEGKTDEAILAVQEMENRGIVGSASLYYDLARCLCAAGRSHEALKQVLFCYLYYSLGSKCPVS